MAPRTTAAEGRAHLARAKAYAAREGGSLSAALRATAPPRNHSAGQAAPEPPETPSPIEQEAHLRRARTHQAQNRGSLTDALRATAKQRKTEPAPPRGRPEGRAYQDAHLSLARAYAKEHGCGISEALSAVARRSEERAEKVVSELLRKRREAKAAAAPAGPGAGTKRMVGPVGKVMFPRGDGIARGMTEALARRS